VNKPYDNEVAAHVTHALFYDRVEPILKANDPSTPPYNLSLTQTAEIIAVQDGANANIYLRVEGPHGKLGPDEVIGCYPSDGSTTSPEEFLPHVAFRRRTLPWERRSIGSDPTTPWMALMLFDETELQEINRKKICSMKLAAFEDYKKPETNKTYTTLKESGYTDDETLDFICIDSSLLQNLLPKADELPLLCHVQKLVLEPGMKKSEAVDQMWTRDPECYAAVLIGNRLPDASKGHKYYACVVSLEYRDDLWKQKDPTAEVYLQVLYHWSFTPAKGGDFQQLMLELSYLPNGGVLSFGALPCKSDGKASVPASIDGSFLLNAALGPKPVKTTYHGPLRPPEAPPPVRSDRFALRAEVIEENPGTTPDVSYAAAFEVGRMLALSDAGLIKDLRNLAPQGSAAAPSWIFPVYYPPWMQQLWAPDPGPDFQSSQLWAAAGINLSESSRFPTSPGLPRSSNWPQKRTSRRSHNFKVR
jgi:hypothetical protein